MDIVRSWKDPAYRASLDDAPESPVGAVEVPETTLTVAGGADIDCMPTQFWGCSLEYIGCGAKPN